MGFSPSPVAPSRKDWWFVARVVLAMSGGVDSSVAASLLQQAGHEVIGVFMRHGEHGVEACSSPADQAGSLPVIHAREHKQGCCSASDAEDARRVADLLDIPFYAIDLHDDFGRIIDYFVDEYLHARTPNPCVVCNNWLKFGRLFDYADSAGASFVASGHYARIVPTDGGPALLRGRDEHKDQSYVLFGIQQHLLSRMLLPVGDYHKDEIREQAQKLGLRVADKRDSQEICFVPAGEHARFIRERSGSDLAAGEIVTTAGEVVGRHAGLENFTIGQRKGLGVACGEPRFVVRLEPDSRRVVIGSKEELGRGSLTADRTNWLVPPPIEPTPCSVKIRYNSRPVPATVVSLPGDCLHIEFDTPQTGVAPGQAVVCYAGDRVMGGGWIE